MTTAPTPEQFLALRDLDDEEPEQEAHPIDHPLASIAASLERLVAITEGHEAEEQASDRLRELLDDLEAKHGVVLELVEEIRGLVKPSTSKLANNVRDAIARWADPEVDGEPSEPAAEPGAESAPTLVQPADDADVEEWRTHARYLGHGRTGPAFNELEQMNRSQIRTLLGIPQPIEEPSA